MLTEQNSIEPSLTDMDVRDYLALVTKEIGKHEKQKQEEHSTTAHSYAKTSDGNHSICQDWEHI